MSVRQGAHPFISITGMNSILVQWTETLRRLCGHPWRWAGAGGVACHRLLSAGGLLIIRPANHGPSGLTSVVTLPPVT